MTQNKNSKDSPFSHRKWQYGKKQSGCGGEEKTQTLKKIVQGLSMLSPAVDLRGHWLLEMQHFEHGGVKG